MILIFTDLKDWIKRRRMDLKYEMATLITLKSYRNQKGLIEISEEWQYIQKSAIPPAAKEMTGERNKYLLNLMEEPKYPEWAINQTSLTATGAYDWLLSTKIFDKIYNEFRDWEHIDFNTIIMVGAVMIGIIYAVYIMTN